MWCPAPGPWRREDHTLWRGRDGARNVAVQSGSGAIYFIHLMEPMPPPSSPCARPPGFTLVETAVALAVAGILGGLALPLALKTMADARIARARHDLNGIAAAIVAQIKDTGGRPMAAGGPGGCSGRAAAWWHSSPQVPSAGPGVQGRAVLDQNLPNTFANLFSSGDAAAGNALFGLGEGNPRDRFRYRGPYLAPAVAGQSDPWGRAYLILGYNQDGQARNGPIWVVCAGPRGTVAPANLGPAPPARWSFDNLSAGNLVVQVR